MYFTSIDPEQLKTIPFSSHYSLWVFLVDKQNHLNDFFKVFCQVIPIHVLWHFLEFAPSTAGQSRMAHHQLLDGIGLERRMRHDWAGIQWMQHPADFRVWLEFPKVWLFMMKTNLTTNLATKSQMTTLRINGFWRSPTRTSRSSIMTMSSRRAEVFGEY